MPEPGHPHFIALTRLSTRKHQSALGVDGLYFHGGKVPQSKRRSRAAGKTLVEVGNLRTTSNYATVAKCSGDTALRDIPVLHNPGVFIRNEAGGRLTSDDLAG